jgi:hypothetical protein
MSSMTLSLGGATLAVAVIRDNVPLALAVFVDDLAVARIVGVKETKVIDGKTFYTLRCLKYRIVDGKYADFTMAEYGPADCPVRSDATTWNGRPAICGFTTELDLVALGNATWGGEFGEEQLKSLLNMGQVLNRMGYRRAGPTAKRVRRVCGK